MPSDVRVRPVDELAVGGITALDEKIAGEYRPDVWESRVMYYLRRDPEGSYVAESEDKIVGFVFGEVRSGEFGQEEPTGWIEVVGVDPDYRGQAVGRQLVNAILQRFDDLGATKVRTLVDQAEEKLHGFFSSVGFREATLVPLELDLSGTTEEGS